MFQLSQTLISLKQVVRGVARQAEGKLSKAKARIVERKRPLTSAPWLGLDPKVWPCQVTDEKPGVSRAPDGSTVTSKSSDPLPFSSSPTSPTSPATPAMFSEDNPSTAAMLNMPPPRIPNILISDYDAEKADRRSGIEREYKDIVGQRSNVLLQEDPKTLGLLAPPGAFPVLKRKKRVIRGNTCPLDGAHIIARKCHLPSSPCALDPIVLLPCRLTDEKRVVSMAPSSSAVTSKSSDFLPCPSSSSSVLPSIFSGDNFSTVTLLTVRPPSIPTIVVQSEHHQTGVVPTIADYDAEKAGRRSKHSRGQKSLATIVGHFVDFKWQALILSSDLRLSLSCDILGRRLSLSIWTLRTLAFDILTGRWKYDAALMSEPIKPALNKVSKASHSPLSSQCALLARPDHPSSAKETTRVTGILGTLTNNHMDMAVHAVRPIALHVLPFNSLSICISHNQRYFSRRRGSPLVHRHGAPKAVLGTKDGGGMERSGTWTRALWGESSTLRMLCSSQHAVTVSAMGFSQEALRASAAVFVDHGLDLAIRARAYRRERGGG
ncbi:hypothetical protein JB92DRAFT_2826979 [Gautieria morchelliformis]|nr:hypothetical protein JB92DRAFT_2826979 [Gautieria morchelliformis]